MPRDRVGNIRRSQLVGTFGPGAIVDFRAPRTGAPVSGVIAGLEEWDACGRPGGLSHRQVIHEPRLQKRLFKKGFRLPPVRISEVSAGSKKNPDANDDDVLPVVRFPNWLQCSRCSRLDRAESWKGEPGEPGRWCAPCTQKDGGKVWVVPVRFVVACENGHLDEFPFQAWIGCHCTNPDLYLEMKGAGLAGKVIRCARAGCAGRPRSLEGVFGRRALTDQKLRCRGLCAWLPVKGGATCDAEPRVLQRGASNVYWSDTVSALDIPPFSQDPSEVLGRHWDTLADKPSEKWAQIIDLLELDVATKMPKEVLLTLLEQWKSAMDGDDADEPLEWAEYQRFVRDEPADEGEFRTIPEPPPWELESYLRRVVLAERLREVRATKGFTRIHPPSGPFRKSSQESCPLSVKALDWLPAIELRGEGVFLELDPAMLREWEERDAVRSRIEVLRASIEKDLFDGEEPPEVSARLVLLHSLAHALVRQLSLECGYSSSALRERLYAGGAPREMAGLLIHTGSPDSEGTLGGLVRRGRSDLLVNTFLDALKSAAWCSSDPLCITVGSAFTSPRNGAACHACLLVPETSCQLFNNLLDRALLVGTPEDPSLGFFHDLIVAGT
jgi:hypothetical protein